MHIDQFSSSLTTGTIKPFAGFNGLELTATGIQSKQKGIHLYELRQTIYVRSVYASPFDLYNWIVIIYCCRVTMSSNYYSKFSLGFNNLNKIRN